MTRPETISRIKERRFWARKVRARFVEQLRQARIEGRSSRLPVEIAYAEGCCEAYEVCLILLEERNDEVQAG